MGTGQINELTNTKIMQERLINTVSNSDADSSYAGVFEEGTVVEGTVTGIEDGKVQIRFENGNKSTELKFDRNSVEGAYKGEKRSFKVMQVTSESVVLKDLGGAATQSGKIVFTAVNTEQLSLLDGFRDVMGDGSEKDDENALKSVYSRMSEDDAKSFWGEGFSMEEYNAQKLLRALERIKLTSEIKQAFREGSVEQLRESTDEIEKISQGNITKTSQEKLLASRLKRANLPVTKENIAELENALALGQELASLSDEAKTYLIKNELKPSIENVYTSSHMGFARVDAMADNVWNELSAQAQQIVSRANEKLISYESGQTASIEDAKWLVERELPLTDENIIYKKQLDNMNIDTPAVLESAVKALKEGVPAKDALLGENEQTADDYSYLVKKYAVLLDEEAFARDGIGAVTSRRRLEETRLHMTVNSSQGRMEASVREAVEEIEQNIEGLKKIEEHYFRSCYVQVGAEETDENVKSLFNIFEQIDILKNSPLQVLSETFERRSTITVGELSVHGAALTSRFEAARETYETVGTQVRRDLGDSMTRAFSNIDELLELSGFEISDANRRAVRIMGYNNIELNRENLEGIKSYDTKVTSIIENMRPVVAAELVQRGIDPLNVPVDELNDMLRQIYDEQGYDTDEKFSEYLVRMEHMGEIDEAQRSAYIGIYRLLNRITQNDGAAVGAVFGSGRELTLGNLLGADRTRRRGHIDVDVDNEFGGLEQVISRGVSITEQILGCITPKKLQNMLSDRQVQDANSLSLDTLLEGLQAQEQTQEDQEAEEAIIDNRMEQLKTAAQGTDEMLILQRLGQPSSMSSIAAMKQMLQSPEIYERLKKLNESLDAALSLDISDVAEKMDDAQELKETYGQLLDESSDTAAQSLEAESIDSVRAFELCSMGSHITLLKALLPRDFYELPLRTEDGRTAQVNLTVVHDSENGGHVRIRLRGNAQCSLELECRNGNVRGFAACETQQELEQIKGAYEDVSEKLTQSGFTLESMNYAVADDSELSYMKRTAALLDNEDQAPTTNDLYRLARIFITSGII